MREPVAYMFSVRDRKRGKGSEFVAIDWSPSPDDERELISKRPLVYADEPVSDAEVEATAKYLESTNTDEVHYQQLDKAATMLRTLFEHLVFVERWAVHHAKKQSAESCLGVIAWYPAIRAITKGYVDERDEESIK